MVKRWPRGGGPACRAQVCLTGLKTKAETYEEQLSVHGPELAYDDEGVNLTLIRRSLDMTAMSA